MSLSSGTNRRSVVHKQRGTLLGLAVGDALGAAVEFQLPGTFEPVTGDPYSLEIPSQMAGEPRRRFSRFRHRRGLFAGETRPAVPILHPDSLLAQLQAAGDTPEMVFATASRVAGSVPEPEEDVDSLIEQYLVETEGTDGRACIARPGDVNIDGTVGAVDVQLVINDALGLDVPWNCDINCDGRVDAVDVQLVINSALRLDISEALASCP